MADWNHPICERCWVEQNTDDAGKVREPVRAHVDYTEQVPPPHCCWCGFATWAGIYTQANPKNMACRGVHEDPVAVVQADVQDEEVQRRLAERPPTPKDP